jgi:hypothetical protein
MGQTHAATLAFHYNKDNDVKRRQILALHPVASELGEESKSGEIAHTVEINFPVQMVPLMLNDPSMEIHGDKFQRFTVAIPSLYLNALVAGRS